MAHPIPDAPPTTKNELQDYRFTNSPCVAVYEDATGSKQLANLFQGEWVKLLDPDVIENGRVYVRYRGGRGYIPAKVLSTNRQLEIYFIDVSKGDAILIQTPDDRRILIDGGETTDALDFIVNKYNLRNSDNYIDFDAIICTHFDSDHVRGLIPILKHKKIGVRQVLHNGLFRRNAKSEDPGPHDDNNVWNMTDNKKNLSPNEQARLTDIMRDFLAAVDTAEANLPDVIKEMGKNPRFAAMPIFTKAPAFECRRLDVAQKYVTLPSPNNSIALRILWPKATTTPEHQEALPWYGDPGKTVNGNSVVLMLEYGKHRILLTGDLNIDAMDDMCEGYPCQPDKNAMDDPELNMLLADVYKAAHHGSQHFSVAFLQRVQPNAAVISSGDDKNDEYGHPRAVLMGTITKHSRVPMPAVFCTELSACFRKLSDKEVEKFTSCDYQLYERSIQGIIHLRSDGKHLCLGTVYGRHMPEDPLDNTTWKWDVWETR